MEGFQTGRIFSWAQTLSLALAFLQAQGSIGVGTNICQVERQIHVMTLLTGMPADVRIIHSSVEENTRASVAFAEANLACTKLGSASDKPSSIFMKN